MPPKKSKRAGASTSAVNQPQAKRSRNANAAVEKTGAANEKRTSKTRQGSRKNLRSQQDAAETSTQGQGDPTSRSQEGVPVLAEEVPRPSPQSEHAGLREQLQQRVGLGTRPLSPIIQVLSAADGEVNERPGSTPRRQAGTMTSSYIGEEVQQQGANAVHDELRGGSSRVNNIYQPEIFNSTEESVSESDLRMRAENQLISRFTSAIENTLQTVRETSVGDGNSRLINRLTSNKFLPTFSGNPCEWLNFKKAFETSSTLGGYTEQENVTRLFASLQGEARETVNTLLAAGGDASAIMNTLELHYGNKRIIAQKIVSDLKMLPEIDSGKIKLTHFASKLSSAVYAFKSFKLSGYLCSSDLIQSLGSKLPSALKYAYNTYAADLTEEKSELENLADFLFKQAKNAIAGGIFGEELELQNSKAPVTSKRSKNAGSATICVASHTDTESSQTSVRGNHCAVCNRDNHKPSSCVAFLRDTLERRWFLVRKLRLCYKCLEQGHLSPNCKGDNCSQCSRPHHMLLHDPSRAKRKNTRNEKPLAKEHGSQQTSHTLTMMHENA